MWRWPTIQAQKDKNAKVKAKTNTIHAKLIALAAWKWSDPNLNSSLAESISNAKKDGVTTDVIDRAIKRWAGIDTDATKVEEIYYEWYAPGGIAIVMRVLTDNRNRTAPHIRHIFSAFGGNMAESGTVTGFAFDFVWEIQLTEPSSRDELELAILESDALDYEFWTDITICTRRETLESRGYGVESATLVYRAKNLVSITDFDTALKLYGIFEACREDEDIETVWDTAHITDELWKEVNEYVESRKFRT
jgi:transcriptional/translational regulatory protein YebC/TACO1